MTSRRDTKAASALGLRYANLAIVLGFGLIAVFGWALYDTREKTRLAVQWVLHSQLVLHAIEQAAERHAVAEVAQRAYLLSGVDTLLRQRDEAISRAGVSIERIVTLTGDSPVQQANARQLAERFDERRKLMENAARLRRERGEQAALDYIATGIPDAASARVREASDRLTREELRLLAVRRADEERREDIAEYALLGALGASIALLVPGYVGFRRQLRLSATLEKRLGELALQLPVALYQLRRRPGGVWEAEYVSERAAEVHGIEAAEAMRSPARIVETVCPEDKPRLLQALEDAVANGPPFEAEYRIGFAGEPCSRWVRSSANMRDEPDGSLLFSGYWQDITEQRRLITELEATREQAHAANRAKSGFLATMSHEIRTPMNGVLGMLELLDLTRLDAEQRSTLAVVRESGRSLLRIIDDILDFSKIEAGRLELHPEVASLAAVVQRTCQLHSGTASSKGLTLAHHVDPKISPAQRFDPLRLGQILSNLISNAIKFTSEGGVEVRADLLDRSHGREMVRLAVTDSGIGISDAQKEALFQPFQQAAANTASKYGGTGLGLAICRRLAEMMGGHVDLASAPGRGTTMSLTLELPIADPALLPAGSGDEQREELASALASRRVAPGADRAVADRTLVLVVDDHPVNRVVLMRQVQTLGYAAEAADNGRSGLEQWSTGRFGLVLTDCNMPTMDGYEMTRRMRRIEAEHGLDRTPVIACTANALRGEAEVCFEAGMDDFLVKPVALNELMARLDRWLPLPESNPMPLDAPPAANEPGAPLDLETLAEISMRDPQAEREILLDFRRINDEDAVLLRSAIAAGEWPQVTRLAHRIKGSCRMVGAEKLADLCNGIERASRTSDARAVASHMEHFQIELLRLNVYLDRLCGRDARPTAPAAL